MLALTFTVCALVGRSGFGWAENGAAHVLLRSGEESSNSLVELVATDNLVAAESTFGNARPPPVCHRHKFVKFERGG